MLKLHQQQLDAFAGDARRRVEQAVGSYLHTDHPEIVAEIGPDRLPEFVREQVVGCERLGFCTAQGICELLDFFLEWGDLSGPDSEWILEVLQSDNSEEQKLQSLRAVWIS